jgi:hypothetical protein
MVAKDKTSERESENSRQPIKTEQQGPEEMMDIESAPLASARNMPRPHTSLAIPFPGNLGKVTVTLLSEASSVPSVEEVEKINKAAPGQARTPLTTMVLAIVARAGGTIALEELCEEFTKHWNRPLPSTPYTFEEFMYIIVRSSDALRVS